MLSFAAKCCLTTLELMPQVMHELKNETFCWSNCMSPSLKSLVGLQKPSCENASSGLETPVPKPAECHDLECCTMNAKV